MFPLTQGSRAQGPTERRQQSHCWGRRVRLRQLGRGGTLTAGLSVHMFRASHFTEPTDQGDSTSELQRKDRVARTPLTSPGRSQSGQMRYSSRSGTTFNPVTVRKEAGGLVPRALGCSRREIVTCAMRPVKGTSAAELNTCLVVTVDETWSLVSRDRDKGFLRGPRDVYILQNNTHTHTHHRTFALWREQMDTHCPAVSFPHHCSPLGSHIPTHPTPRSQGGGTPTPAFP